MPEIIAPPKTMKVTFSLEPAFSAVNSLELLNEADEFSGFDEWIYRTVATLSPERLHNNAVVFVGLIAEVHLLTRSWPSFPAWLDDLAASDPKELRDLELDRLLEHAKESLGGELPTPEQLLANRSQYLKLVNRLYSCEEKEDSFDQAIHREAHALFNDPPAMQALIVTHLREMWDKFLAVEWERVRPMLQDSVDAFQQLDFTGRTAVDVACMIDPTLGEELEKWGEHIARARQVIFVPSAHIGPYVRKFGGEGVFGIFFGARLPEGTQVSSPALTRSELMVRLGALADDTRLGILDLLAQHDELCAKDIMTHLDLSQSAASRHLRQLSATGYVTERRQEGAKCYRLNRDRFRSTLRAMEQFLD